MTGILHIPLTIYLLECDGCFRKCLLRLPDMRAVSERASLGCPIHLHTLNCLLASTAELETPEYPVTWKYEYDQEQQVLTRELSYLRGGGPSLTK